MRVAYFVNQYPAASHTFIRRELQALERLGLPVQRYALRGWDGPLPGAEDQAERSKTRYVLRAGIARLLAVAAATLAGRPLGFLRATRLALALWRNSGGTLWRHGACLAEACQLAAWLRSGGIDHLHAHFGSNSATVAMLARELGGPAFSFTAHGPEEFDRAEQLSLAEKIRRARFVVAVSSYGRSQLFRHAGQEHWPKVRVVHCGIEREFYDGADTPPPAALRLVCVGRLSEQKGQFLLIAAAQRLAARGLDFELVLAGDGDLRAPLEAMVRGMGLAGRIRVTGWISSQQVRGELLAARALVLPSFAEGLPVVLMEAMALRRPVLATHVAGIPELVRHGEDGWLVPAGCVDALADAMEEILRCPAAELGRRGEAARRRVLERHSIDIEAAKLGRLFEAGP